MLIEFVIYLLNKISLREVSSNFLSEGLFLLNGHVAEVFDGRLGLANGLVSLSNVLTDLSVLGLSVVLNLFVEVFEFFGNMAGMEVGESSPSGVTLILAHGEPMVHGIDSLGVLGGKMLSLVF